MAIRVLGLDIGGANLKAAHSDGVARTVPFALWKQPERLAAELARLRAAMPPHDQIALTMTGELCDCFPTRRAGVKAILHSALLAAAGIPVVVWSKPGRFVSPELADGNPGSVAAANWLALAHFVASRFADERVLLIDTGSTTTDIVYLNRGVPEPRALEDAERLLTGELVYTGLRRTPVCAVLGIQGRVAAEFFATMLDAYVMLGTLPEDPDDRDTADGRPMTRAFAHARLARLRCTDVDAFSEGKARALAGQAVQAQQRAILEARANVLNGRPAVDRHVVSGSGEIVGSMAARRRGKLETALAHVLGRDLSEAACAYAVALLAAEEAMGA